MRYRSKQVLVLVGIFCAVASAGDWPFWRGPEQTGATSERAVVKSWTLGGENLLWKVPVGGRTTPIVMDGRVFVIGPVGEGIATQERIVCLDADTGDIIWEHRFNVFDTTIALNRVGWTALVGDPETGNVYAHGTGGEMFCFSRNGQLIWKVSMTEELGRISGYGGRLATPILDEDRVIVNFLSSSWGAQARPRHRYVAFDKRDGRILWWAGPGKKPLDTTYSTPVVALIGGVRQLIAANADGNVYGMKARTGATLWSFRLSKRGLNSSIVVYDHYAYAAHSEENIDNTEMGRVVCIDANKRGDITQTGEVWRFAEKTVGYASPSIANGRLYVIDNAAKLYCLDARTGQYHWEYSLGRVGKGSPVVTADGVIYVGEQTGIFHILQDRGTECISLDRKDFKRPDGLVDEMFGSPAVADGRVYFMTRYNTYCLGRPGVHPRHVPPPTVATDEALFVGPATHGQVHPAEVTLRPGESVHFEAFVSDSAGHRLRPMRHPHWSVGGVPGHINADGMFTALAESDFSVGSVNVTGEEIKAAARIRIIPKLPIHEGFEAMAVGKPPPGWVGAAGKTRIEERDGNHILRKMASKKHPNPPFMRLRTYATPPLKGGYTVMADMLGTPKKRIKPDMGLMNSRYRMIVMGRNKLRMESWSPMPRFRHDVPLKWNVNTWYRVKFQVKLEGDRAIVRGKVWPRDSEEPAEWSTQAVDPYPNREGSAGLYAYSTNTTAKSDGPEVFFDNFQVMRNE